MCCSTKMRPLLWIHQHKLAMETVKKSICRIWGKSASSEQVYSCFCWICLLSFSVYSFDEVQRLTSISVLFFSLKMVWFSERCGKIWGKSRFVLSPGASYLWIIARANPGKTKEMFDLLSGNLVQSVKTLLTVDILELFRWLCQFFY